MNKRTRSLAEALEGLLEIRGVSLDSFLVEAIYLEAKAPTQPVEAPKAIPATQVAPSPPPAPTSRPGPKPKPTPHVETTALPRPARYKDDAPNALAPLLVPNNTTEDIAWPPSSPAEAREAKEPPQPTAKPSEAPSSLRGHRLITMQSLFPEVTEGEVFDMFQPGQFFYTTGPYWLEPGAFANLPAMLEALETDAIGFDKVPAIHAHSYRDLSTLGIKDARERLQTWRDGGRGVIYQPFNPASKHYIVDDAFYASIFQKATTWIEYELRRLVFYDMPKAYVKKICSVSQLETGDSVLLLPPCHMQLKNSDMDDTDNKPYARKGQQNIYAATSDSPAAMDGDYVNSLIKGSKVRKASRIVTVTPNDTSAPAEVYQDDPEDA